MIFRSILNDDIWTVFGLICGLLITSCLIEIIYHFDFKSLFAHKNDSLSSVPGGSGSHFLGFRLDVADMTAICRMLTRLHTRVFTVMRWTTMRQGLTM